MTTIEFKVVDTFFGDQVIASFKKARAWKCVCLSGENPPGSYKKTRRILPSPRPELVTGYFYAGRNYSSLAFWNFIKFFANKKKSRQPKIHLFFLFFFFLVKFSFFSPRLSFFHFFWSPRHPPYWACAAKFPTFITATICATPQFISTGPHKK